MSRLIWSVSMLVAVLGGSLFAACSPHSAEEGSASLQGSDAAGGSTTSGTVTIHLQSQLSVGHGRETNLVGLRNVDGGWAVTEEQRSNCLAVVRNVGNKGIPAAKYVLKPVGSKGAYTQKPVIYNAEGYTRVDYRNAHLALQFMVSWPSSQLTNDKDQVQIRKMKECINSLRLQLKGEGI